MVPRDLTVRYRGSADDLFAWYRDTYPTMLRASGAPFTGSSSDEASRTVTCDFAAPFGNQATFRYSVVPGDELDGQPTAVVRLATSVKKALLGGGGFESSMLGLYMATDQFVAPTFPLVPDAA